MSYSLGATALPFCSLVRIAAAQVPQVAVEGAASTVVAAPAVLQAQTAPMRQPEPVTEDAGESDDFLHRQKPQANLWEAGVFLGPLFISDRNSFRGRTVVNPGRPPTVQPISTFKQPSVEIGIRGGYFPLSFLGGELEGMVAAAESDADGGATVLAARLHVVAQLPYWSIVPFAAVGVGYWGVLNDVSGDDTDPAFHYGGGAKLNVTRNLAVRLDVRDTITNQRGDGSYPHNIEALAGANLVFGRVVAPKDSDRDGLIDSRDQCPLEAGTLPNGCPVRDSDADGIMDPDDRCVMEVGLPPTGCPIRDADEDGVADAEDQCISEKGGAPTGCPDGDQDGFLDRADRCPAVSGVAPDGCLADADGDGFLAADDRCPDEAETKNGFEDADGCPDELPAEVKNFMGVIAGIEFDRDQAEIRPTSEIALEQALSVLSTYPSLRIEIIGHTDNRGSREHNVELSLRRAEAVKAHFVARGIDPSRISSKGEGPDVPLTTNDNQAGRQKNRRIEFRVIQ
jgi:outer membrane protein OmpA-like peptidoglycan-associated protein